ncbi:MAG: bifunctional nuclease family protein [Nitrospirae bacterium]|nr:MAG: bifunctional nuclease family protein [Nitrospirota bacterium]
MKRPASSRDMDRRPPSEWSGSPMPSSAAKPSEGRYTAAINGGKYEGAYWYRSATKLRKEEAMKRLGLSLVLCAVGGLCLGLSGAVSQVGQVLQAPMVAAASSPAQVEIKDVDVRLSDQGPVVLLKAENRAIPIFVDPTVAGSILGALTGQKMRRPLSHDLMHSILTGFGGTVTKTVITLKDGVYYGALTVAMPNMSKVFDSRSSDAIALAIHFKAPILVGRDLLESAGTVMPDTKELTL